MVAARRVHRAERGGAAGAAIGLATRTTQCIGPFARPARAGPPAAARQGSVRAIAIPVLLARARGAKSVPGGARLRVLPVRSDSPRPPLSRDSIGGGGRRLSGWGMLHHRVPVRRPGLPSSFPAQMSLVAREAVARHGVATGNPGGGGVGVAQDAGGGGHPSPHPFRGDARCFLEYHPRANGGQGITYRGGAPRPFWG